MAYEHKENKGSIFKNDRKEKDTHPDYTGQINVAGTLYNISGWINESKGGKNTSDYLYQFQNQKITNL